MRHDRVARIFNRTESKQRVLGKENDTFARSVGAVPLVDVRDVAKAIAMIVALQTTTTMTTTTTTNAGRKKNVDGSSQITNTEYVVTGYNLSCRDFAEKLHELYGWNAKEAHQKPASVLETPLAFLGESRRSLLRQSRRL